MNDEELLRYSRQIMLPEIDVSGQEKLCDAHVLIIGLGGLGCPVAMYLAAAGIGHLTLVDFDEVDLSNLQRQIAHTSDRIGESKVSSAATSITALNPNVQLTCLNQKLDADALLTVIENADLVLDCTDNFDIRFKINAACVQSRTALVSGAAIRLEGQVLVFDPDVKDCPCYQCLYHEADDSALNCAENGVAAPVVGVIGAIQATEAIKLIAGFGQTLAGRLLVFDAKSMEWRKLKLQRDPDCKTCGQA